MTKETWQSQIEHFECSIEKMPEGWQWTLVTPWETFSETEETYKLAMEKISTKIYWQECEAAQ